MPAPRILIVDDEPLNVDFLQQELEGPEFEILTAANGNEALERVQAGRPDLVLLDIMMPVMDGFEVLRRLKADAASRSIPVIVISAATDMASVVRGIQLGAEDFLPKPFEPTLLRARISSSLEKKRLHDLEQVYRKGLERELDIAREIQQGFLPAELPKLEGWELAAYFQAAREVAGDFYDAFVLPDGQARLPGGRRVRQGRGCSAVHDPLPQPARARPSRPTCLRTPWEASLRQSACRKSCRSPAVMYARPTPKPICSPRSSWGSSIHGMGRSRM